MPQQDNVQVSFGIQGMERTTHEHLVSEKSYTFARNANLETDVNTLGLTNEHSNLLCSKMRPGYTVVGLKYDQLNSKVWFFLTQKETHQKTDGDGNPVLDDYGNPLMVRNSEIGWIDVQNNYTDESDLEQDCGCDIISILKEPLENSEQIPFCKYTPLFQDDCNNCLNFDPNFPVHTIVLKQESCGQTMTFASKNNPPRYIILDRTDYYTYSGDINCGVDNRVDVCLDCEKMRLFPNYSQPYIHPEVINHGGSLRRGAYEFYIAYCDRLGNEMTEYVSCTNPVTVFDFNNVQLKQPTRFDNSNQAIKLRVDNLDPRFNFYKVVVIEKADISQVTTAFVEGIHSTSDNNIIYASNGSENDQRISLQRLFLKKPIYKNFGGVLASNGYLFGYDYEVEKEWNLQPVVNLLGSFAKWQTIEADEDLYRDGVNDSLYKGYMRDEVYPLGIRFIADNGYKTSVFPLMPRPAFESEKTVYSLNSNSNLDIESILTQGADCSNTDRKYKWQFYNTGQVLGNSYNDDDDRFTEIITKEVQEECIQEDYKVLENSELYFDTENPFSSISELTQNPEVDVCNPTDEYYNPKLCSLLQENTNRENCDFADIFTFPICDGSEDCQSRYCDPESPEYSLEICTNIRTSCPDGEKCSGICETPVEGESHLYIGNVLNEVITRDPKRYPGTEGTAPTYTHNLSNTCNQFIQNTPETKTLYVYSKGEGNVGEQVPMDIELSKIRQRVEIFNNNTCGNSAPIGSEGMFFMQDYSGLINVITSIGAIPLPSANYIKNRNSDPSPTEIPTGTENLLTDVPAGHVAGFEDRVHIQALWIRIDLEDNDEHLLEITPVEDKGKDITTLTDDLVRINIYDNCLNPKPLFTDSYKSSEGYWKVIRKKDFTNKASLYAVLDTKILKDVKLDSSGKVNDTSYKVKGTLDITSTVPGCFDVTLRPQEFYRITSKFDRLSVNKSTEFTSLCRFNAPKSLKCGAIPHKIGLFSYWESIEEYPDNTDLYDSSIVKLSLDNLLKLQKQEPVILTELFRKEYIQEIQGTAVWKKTGDKSAVDFTCKPIRHYKFPDNTVVPFMSSEYLFDYVQSRIHPIGVTFNEDTINTFLDVAVDSGLLNRQQRSSIIGYEIFRGDRTISKSIITKGILSDMYEDPVDKESGRKTYFRNFPYNSLGKNEYLTTDEDRKILLPHPYGSVSNNRFSFIAPEVYVTRPKPPSEMVIDGYMYGAALNKIIDVKDHSEWVILGENAYGLADKLAKAEVIMESALNIATLMVDSTNSFWFGWTGTSAVGMGLALAATAVYAGIQLVNAFTYKKPRYMAQWLETFENRGSVYNFAAMSVSPKGFYNYFKPNRTKGQSLRSLISSIYLSNGIDVTIEKEGSTNTVTMINNIDREDSIYLFTGENYHVKYPREYSSYDNSDMSPRNASRYIASQFQCRDITSNRRIASPYVTLRNYVPDQYGKIDEVKWLSTNHDPLFGSDKNVFGGDVFITRTDLKNKVKLFNKTAVGLQNRTPFKYSRASNIAYPRFYVDYKSSDKSIGTSIDMPYLDSDYKMDCRKGGKKFYEGYPAKFYLYLYGVPYFLTETEINTNYRYANEEYHEQFASKGIDVYDWVQETNVSIAHNNYFYYNSVYSRAQTGLSYRNLTSNYDRNFWDCLSEEENGVAWSEQDNSEVSLSDPWLVWRPFNIYKFPFNFGKLVSLDNIESTQVIGRFYNNMTVFNAVDVLKDRVTPDSEMLGTGGIFASGRPVQFSYTELGETGSQHRSMVSCEFGHFWVDAKRGKVYQLGANAQGLTPISDFKKEGGESGMRRWFKRHLPMKILNQGIQGLKDEHVDNTFKGLGILMWWDSRFKRVFITKRDYQVRRKYKNQISFSGLEFYHDNKKIELYDPEYFKDVSWTVAYSPIYGCWVSYYDFKPNYAIALHDYFKTGINYSHDPKEEGLWSHLLSNKTYQVFYGKYYPFEIELPIKNTYTNNVLKDLKFWTLSHRYHDNFDFAVWRKKSFNKLTVYNQTNNSGLLHLNYDDSTRKSKYPVPLSQTEQGIQATHHEDYVSVNYMYNRVKNEEAHVPVWNNDDNEILKDLNPNVISFNSKRVLERLRGDWFYVHLVQDNTSQFKQIFKWMVSRETAY